MSGLLLRNEITEDLMGKKHVLLLLFTPTPQNVSMARKVVRETAKDLLGEMEASSSILAAGELVQNGLLHGAGDHREEDLLVSLRYICSVSKDGHGIEVITLCDPAHGASPRSIDREGDRGLMIIERLGYVYDRRGRPRTVTRIARAIAA